MASDLISRTALLQLLYEKWLNNTPNRTCFFLDGEIQRTAEAVTIEKIMKEIEGMPTVDAAPVVHGEWLSAYEYALKIGMTDKERLEEAKRDKRWKFCNNCEQQVNGIRNYCPNCGAKWMGGERK